MVYIIIPVFNRLRHTQKCIESLFKQSYQDFKVVLVDDGSTDGTAEAVGAMYPEVKIIKGSGSWWWARSMNEGIGSIIEKTGPQDFVLSLNNDLIVLPDYLEQLLSIANKYPKSMVGSVSLWDSDYEVVDFAGVKWNPWTARYKNNDCSNLSYSELVKCGDYIETDLLPGRGTIFPVALLRQIGLYDCLNFPQYIADEDFSLRARNIGFDLLLATKACVISDVENTGLNFKLQAPTWKIFSKSLFSMRSANNIKFRYLFAMKHGKVGVLYFLFDLGRLIGSFVKRKYL